MDEWPDRGRRAASLPVGGREGGWLYESVQLALVARDDTARAQTEAGILGVSAVG